jgi:hypothetical protein
VANPLPNENELYERIKKEGIHIDPGIWDLIYHRAGDDLSAIHLLCQYYLTSGEAIPAAEATKILAYTRDIKDVINTLTVVSKEDCSFPQVRDDIPLHPIIREMFTHYIGNDVYVINLIVQDAIDPLCPGAVTCDAAQKILSRVRSTKDFMERLRLATFRSPRNL